MIAEFKVRNFYSIRQEQSLSFMPSSSKLYEDEFLCEVKPGVRLLKMGLIFGANASGKTNILRALDTFRKLMVFSPSDKLKGLDFVPFLLDQGSREENTYMEMIFYLDRVKYCLNIEYDAKRIVKEELTITESIKSALAYKRTFCKNTDQPLIEFGTKIKLSKKSRQAIVSNTLNNSTVLSAFGKTNTEASLLDKVYEYFTASFQPLLEPNMLLSSFVKDSLSEEKNGKLKNFLLKMLKASDFNIVNVDIREEGEANPELSFEHKTADGTFSLPENLESIGTIRYMGMALLLSRLLQFTSMVSIDEVESSIYSDLVAYFIKIFLANSENNSQLLMTTHDLNLMNEDFLRRDVLWSADKQTTGETHLNRFSEMGLHKSASIYNAYRQGKLGQLPFLENIYINLNDPNEK